MAVQLLELTNKTSIFLFSILQLHFNKHWTDYASDLSSTGMYTHHFYSRLSMQAENPDDGIPTSPYHVGGYEDTAKNLGNNQPWIKN